MHRNKSIKLLSEDLNNKERVERKQIEHVCEAFSKLIQQCNKKELKVVDLKWQPHYSAVFKQIKAQLELILTTDTTKTLEKLNSIPYLLCLKNSIFTLLNSFSKFVSENSSLIGTDDNHLRKTFFVKVVHFQFLAHEIQAYFPGGIYSPSKVKISKMPARAWWEKMFGEITFVDLDVFVSKFKEDYPFVNQAEIFAFKNSINFTSTNLTTKFEFDLFTRLYSPWERINEAWRIIYNHPAYLHFSTYGDTKDILSRYLDRPGTYVFRVSCKDLGFWTIGYVKASKDMGQIKVDKTNLIEALVEGHKKGMYLYPNGEYTNPDLNTLNQYRKEIVVKKEELQLYGCFEDYKECKICRESEKDLQLESCGHQICHGCFKMLRKYNKKLCPFCNQNILSTTRIVNITAPPVYIEANPGARESLYPNDHLYADMSLESRDPSRSENDVNVQIRSDGINRTAVPSSIYSNTSDEFVPIELPTLAQPEVPPEAPPRPHRDRITTIKNVFPKKTEIVYPAMQITKEGLAAENHLNTVLPTLKKPICPPSPLYAEMRLDSAPTNGVSIPVDDLYCDVGDQALHDPPPHIADYHEGRATQNLNATPFHNGPCYNEDIYCSPIDPIEDAFPSLNPTNETNHSLETDREDIYCDPISMPDDEDVYAFPTENHNQTLRSLGEAVAEASVSAVIVDDLYSHFSDDADDADENGAKEDDILAKWSDRDVARALRVARNDRMLARDILEEFVGTD